MQNLSFIGILHEFRNEISSHEHTIWEIVCYTKGSGKLTVGNISYNFKEGDIFCLPPKIPHSEHSDNGFKNIHMGIGKINKQDNSVYQFTDSKSNDFRNIMIQIHRECYKRQNNWENICECLLNVLNQYIYAWTPFELRHPLVENLENTIIANMSNSNFSPGLELEKMPMSKDHLRRLFKKQTGKTPVEYLMSMRISYAASLLESNRSSSIKVNEVAKMSGFSDPYYFSRVFKKITGNSPSRFIP